MYAQVTSILSLLGTFAFAVSGIKFASGKKIDWFGAYIIGFVTAIGGGTLRDLLLDTDVFWMHNPQYLITTFGALLAAIIFKESLFRLGNTLFMFDTIGLGLFTVVGISKSLAVGYPFWVCIIMGTITGTVGGVIRDVLINEVPLLLRKDIYALTCIIGGVTYITLDRLGFPLSITETLSAIMIIILRILAVKFHWHLPIFSTEKRN